MRRFLRFLLCIAVAFFIMLPPPMLPHQGGRAPDMPIPGPDPNAFFALAFKMAVTLLLATALYAAVLFVEHVWRWRRRSRGGRT